MPSEFFLRANWLSSHNNTSGLKYKVQKDFKKSIKAYVYVVTHVLQLYNITSTMYNNLRHVYVTHVLLY